MKKFIFILLLYLISFSVMSQKVTMQVIKAENSSLSDWQILDEKYRIVFSGDDYYRSDSVIFSLDANKKFILQISVTEIYKPDTSIYTLVLNDEPIILIGAEIGPGDHFFPFYTGTRDNDVKITGGTTALISDFPWQVFFRAANYQCGGSIISENWVVTAAHCTEDEYGNPINASEMSVKVGTNNPYNIHDGQTYSVSEVVVNEGFNNQTLVNDIALLKLQQPINYINATPIKLITSDDVAGGATVPGVMSWVTGYGLTNVNPDIFPTSLQKVQLPIISNAQASTVWKSIPSTDIMAGYLDGNKDACSGDSGGPMAVPVFDEYKLAGLVSWGSPNCNTYGAYTRVSDFETWIRAKTGIVKEYRPPPPVGDTLICQGVESSGYSIDVLSGATAYEWRLLPAEAGTISWNNINATVLWNTGFTGSATLILRVTINGTLSEWSSLNVKAVKNTKILSVSADTAICAGQAVSLKIVAEGYNLIYNWYQNGQLIQSGASSQLNYLSAIIANSGDYSCVISGYCGIVNSGIIKLTVHPLTKIYYISPDTEVPFGKDVSLEVKSEGYDLTYQWQKDGVTLDYGTASLLFLQNLNATAIGLYKAIVAGTCGTEVSNNVYLYVKKTNYSGEPEVFLWPTVTTSEIHVAVSTDAYYSIRIFDTSGRLFKELTNCRYETTVDVNALPKGVCIINVFNNSFRKSLKMIRE